MAALAAAKDPIHLVMRLTAVELVPPVEMVGVVVQPFAVAVAVVAAA